MDQGNPTGRHRPAISLAFRLTLGVIFCASGLAKIPDPLSFISTLWAFKLFPEPIVPLLTIYVPWLELELGLLLILGLFWRTGALLIGLLNVTFALALLSLVIRGIDVDCGCFGLLSDMLGLPDMANSTAVARDTIFALMSLYVYRTGESMFTLEAYIKKTRKSQTP